MPKMHAEKEPHCSTRTTRSCGWTITTGTGTPSGPMGIGSRVFLRPPLAIWEENISSGTGLQAILRRVLNVSAQRAMSTPVLLDIDIYWRVLKLVYVQSNGAAYPIRNALGRVVPFFGIRHAYKHCVTSADRTFAPYMAAIEYAGYLANPETENVYTTPDLVAMERLFLSL